MKHNLMVEYMKADLSGKNILQPIIDEINALLATGRTYLSIHELLDFPLKQKKEKQVE